MASSSSMSMSISVGLSSIVSGDLVMGGMPCSWSSFARASRSRGMLDRDLCLVSIEAVDVARTRVGGSTRG